MYGDCGGFKFPSPFSTENVEIIEENQDDQNLAIEEASVENSPVEAGGCNFASVPTLPLFLIVPVLLAIRKRIRG